MTKTFQITANQNLMGEYAGETAGDAVMAYMNDAGYDSVEDCARRLDQTVEQVRSEIDVTEIDVDKLVVAVAEKSGQAVFQDSYGNGIALVNGESYATYRDLADAFELDLDAFCG